ncbi:hypothetical protein EJB05_32647, partial [Eragrostis curvula]
NGKGCSPLGVHRAQADGLRLSEPRVYICIVSALYPSVSSRRTRRAPPASSSRRQHATRACPPRESSSVAEQHHHFTSREGAEKYTWGWRSLLLCFSMAAFALPRPDVLCFSRFVLLPLPFYPNTALATH